MRYDDRVPKNRTIKKLGKNQGGEKRGDYGVFSVHEDLNPLRSGAEGVNRTRKRRELGLKRNTIISNRRKLEGVRGSIDKGGGERRFGKRRNQMVTHQKSRSSEM